MALLMYNFVMVWWNFHKSSLIYTLTNLAWSMESLAVCFRFDVPSLERLQTSFMMGSRGYPLYMGLESQSH